jgi:WD40 repeat protein
LRYVNGKLYSGGKDGIVNVINTGSLTVESSVDFGGLLIRAIDVMGTNMIVGLRDGSIQTVNLTTQAKKKVMESHSDGEVWGLAIPNGDLVLTTGDDNQVKAWSVSARKCTATGRVSDKSVTLKRRGASSLTTYPDSKCARAIAYNLNNQHVAVGHNDGTLTVRASPTQLDNIIHENKNSKEWIEAIQFSPDGSKLAVGSHDNNIYIYETSGYGLIGKCSKHNSFIVSVDWSLDGQFIRSVCGAHELLFFNGNTYQQDPNGPSNTTKTVWATNSAKFGWLVDGVFPAGTDGTHINHVAFSNDRTLIATGDDYGLVNVFRNPCRKGHQPISLRGHSEHVVRVGFNSDDSRLFSIGGYD